MAFTNGQPWRIQPWNTEQDSETLGPWTSAGLSLPTGVKKIGKHLAVSNNYAYSYGAFNKSNFFLPKLLLAAPINSEGVLGNWEIVTEDSEFEFLRIDLRYTSVPILTNKINEVWVAKDYTEAMYPDGRYIIYKENNIITRDKIISFSIEGFRKPYLYEYFESEINKDGDIDKAYKRKILNASSQEYIIIDTVFPTKSKNDNNDRIYVGLTKFWYVEVDKKTGNITGDFKEESSTIINSILGTSQGCCSVVTANRVYIFAGNYGSGYVVPSSSAPINDDASIGEFTAFSAPDKVESAIITSSRIYVVTQEGIIYWAPFGGGANDYTTYATYGGGPETNTISGRYEVMPDVGGQGESAAAGTFLGRYDLVQEIRGRGETAADATVAGHYEMRPTVAGRGETKAPTAPTTGRYELLPHAKGRGESAADGTLRAQYDLRPEVRGDAECVETGLVRADYELAPRIAARGLALRYLNPPGIGTGTGDGKSPGYYLRPQVRGVMEYAEDDLTRGHVTMPMFECRGKAHVRRRIEGRFDMPMFECRGKVARPAPVGTGRWEHPLFQVAGRASLRMRHEGYGHYVLPVPRRIRGRMLWEDDDWVLRFKRPEVL